MMAVGMASTRLPFLLLLLWQCLAVYLVDGYEPTWESLDSRPLPGWYDEAKFGIFIHWGVFSVPAYGGAWFWNYWGRTGDAPSGHPYAHKIQAFVNKTELSNFAYADYAHRFDATLYNATHWASVIAQSGAQYMVLTSKHHEGFCNWDSREGVPTSWNWNAMEVGPRRDLVGELAKAVKQTVSKQTKKNLHYGLYHSLFEFYNPLYEVDKDNNYTTQHFVNMKVLPALYDLVNKYEPEIIWSDGDWEAHSDYWKSTTFLAWYATDSPVAETAVWNDRWGRDTKMKHGGFYNGADRFLPTHIYQHKWENALTIAKNRWAYDRSLTLKDFYDADYLIHTMLQTVAYNGNYLLNVGPRADGTLDPIFEDRLMEIGRWMTINGEGIYGSRPWNISQHEPACKVFYTTKAETRVLYAFFTEWPEDNKLRLMHPVATEQTKVHMLGLPSAKRSLTWTADSKTTSQGSGGMTVDIPALTPRQIPCQHAWTLAISGIGNFDVPLDESFTQELTES